MTQTASIFRILPDSFGKACRSNKCYQEWRNEEFADWHTTDELKIEWLSSKANPTDQELLQIFPEARDYLEERHNFITYKQLPKLKKRLKEALKAKLEQHRTGFDSWFQTEITSLWFEGIAEPLEKEVRRIKRFLFPEKTTEKITPAMIERAKAVPMKTLLGTDKDFVLCPFHVEKKASFYIKENAQGHSFGYCFSCGESCDSIKYIMKTQDLNFPDAVKTLNRY